MDYVKKAIWGPDTKEQHRKIKITLRKNGRSIDKSLRDLSILQSRTQQLIKKTARKNDIRGIRIYARELYRVNRQYDRMYTSKAQLESVRMKIEEAFRMRILSSQIADSAGLMREVNSLIKLPQLQGTMVELEKELMKAGIITEMVDNSMESMQGGDEEMDEEVDAEINRIVEQYTDNKFENMVDIPESQLATGMDTIQQEEKDEQEVPEDQIDEEADNMLNAMKERLKALQN